MKTIAIVQARMGSTRVPGKVMRMLGGKPVLRWTVDAVTAAVGIDDVILATSKEPADDAIVTYCARNGIPFFRGSESDVLDRFYQCAKKHKADIVLRFTADCPFLDPAVIGEVVKLREMTNADYASNCYPPTYPDGLDTECFTFQALETAWKEATSQVDRDCLTQFIVRNRNRFKVVNLTCPLPGLVKERWVLDTEKDWELCQKLASYASHCDNQYVELLDFLDLHPEIRALNAGGIRNERFYEALAEEQLSPRTFERSQRIFERASKVIPLAAQTFSKSHLQFPKGQYPLYASYGDGAYIFDVDGNRYVDLVGALGPNILGYNDPDVNEAIRRQLDNAGCISLATELESELAELLCKHIPCAEMVRFGKSGTDATTAAVRLARAYTKRNYVFSSGYHGWADWSIGSTNRNHGIPEDVSDLTIELDKERLIKWVEATWIGDTPPVAAVIVEPNDDPEYLQWLRDYCTKHGIVLIFDEVITGFRYGLGGAQELYGVTPDLACFGKAMANGMPISALVGKREIMKLMETPDVFYSGTFFGETLSIAAAIATIKKLEHENVIDYITKAGADLEFNILKMIKIWGLQDNVFIDGWYTNQKISFRNHPRATADQMRTLFMMEMAQQGVLIINSNVLSFAHKGPELKRIKHAYNIALSRISYFLKNENNDSIADELGDSVIAASPLRATA